MTLKQLSWLGFQRTAKAVWAFGVVCTYLVVALERPAPALRMHEMDQSLGQHSTTRPACTRHLLSLTLTSTTFFYYVLYIVGPAVIHKIQNVYLKVYIVSECWFCLSWQIGTNNEWICWYKVKRRNDRYFYWVPIVECTTRSNHGYEYIASISVSAWLQLSVSQKYIT